VRQAPRVGARGVQAEAVAMLPGLKLLSEKHPGITHLALAVHSVEEAEALLRRAGCVIPEGPVTFSRGVVSNSFGQTSFTISTAHSSFSALLHSPDRKVRRTAFHQYYEVFQGHENALAATLSGSVQGDIYYAKARGYSSAIDSALFDDNVPIAVYDNLIAAVREKLPALYRYFELRRRNHIGCDIPSRLPFAHVERREPNEVFIPGFCSPQ
jgi:hypothetical protein